MDDSACLILAASPAAVLPADDVVTLTPEGGRSRVSVPRPLTCRTASNRVPGSAPNRGPFAFSVQAGMMRGVVAVATSGLVPFPIRRALPPAHDASVPRAGSTATITATIAEGRAAELHLRLRCFRCDAPDCLRRIVAERFEPVAPPRLRQTRRWPRSTMASASPWAAHLAVLVGADTRLRVQCALWTSRRSSRRASSASTTARGGRATATARC